MPMDRLLEKLRQNMAELSIQGDDFTRQIWHMYASFEEFLDHHTSFGRSPNSSGGGGGGGTGSATQQPNTVIIPSPLPSTNNATSPTVQLATVGVGEGTDRNSNNNTDELSLKGGIVGVVGPTSDSNLQISPNAVDNKVSVPLSADMQQQQQQKQMEVQQHQQQQQQPPQHHQQRGVESVASTRRPLMVGSDLDLDMMRSDLEELELELRLGLEQQQQQQQQRGMVRGTSQDDMSLFYRKPTRGRFRRGGRREVSNPLLETISAIEDMCESDDYSELPGNALYPPGGVLGRSLGMMTTDLDPDAIGYAGSNSIDSGYKSSCPTPDLSDGTYYCNEFGIRQDASRRTSITSLASQLNGTKPRIAMGTKVMGRHPSPSSRGLPTRGSRSSDPGYYDSTLDHLLHLRQSILNAMRRYDSVTMTTTTTTSAGRNNKRSSSSSPGQPSPRLSPGVLPSGFVSPRNQSPISRSFPTTAFTYHQRPRSRSPLDNAFRPRSASASSAQKIAGSPSPVLQSPNASPLLSRRFQSGTSSLANLGSFRSSYPNSRTQSPSFSSASSGKSSPGYSKNVRFNSRAAMTCASPGKMARSKPILKDPLCASLRNPPDYSPDDPTLPIPLLEEEIDTFLYGRTRRMGGNLTGSEDQRAPEPAPGDIPCSYVTMLEDKYRRSSLARVKRLRARACGPVGDSSSTSSSSDSSPVHRPVKSAPTSDLSTAAAVTAAAAAAAAAAQAAKSGDANKPSRFTEMAQCMLEIIDNLQNQKLSPDGEQPQQQQQQMAPQQQPPPPPPTTQQAVLQHRRVASDLSSPYMTKGAADYHVYEEIMYELMAPSKKDPIPPPLPARPTGIFPNNNKSIELSSVGIRAAKMPTKKPILPLSQMAKSQATTKQQRANIYTLFNDQMERRGMPKKRTTSETTNDFAKNKPSETSNEDEYGFKMVKHVM